MTVAAPADNEPHFRYNGTPHASPRHEPVPRRTDGGFREHGSEARMSDIGAHSGRKPFNFASKNLRRNVGKNVGQPMAAGNIL